MRFGSTCKPRKSCAGCGSLPEMKAQYPVLAVLIVLVVLPAPTQAQSPDHDLYFLGYETEPAMDFGGRTLTSLQSGLSRAFGSIRDMGERHPGLAPSWEFPVAAAILLVQHEVGGHGGRGREFGLSPSYGFGIDFSGYTNTK